MQRKGIKIMLTDEEIEDIRTWVEDAEKELFPSVVALRFKYIAFVSSSKGRGRKRKHLTEIQLINDIEEPHRFFTWDKFPFDVKSDEVYGVYEYGLDGLACEEKLRREIKQ